MALLGFLGERLTLPRDRDRMEENDDALDAVLCVLAGADSRSGQCAPPDELALSKNEGWI